MCSIMRLFFLERVVPNVAGAPSHRVRDKPITLRLSFASTERGGYIALWRFATKVERVVSNALAWPKSSGWERADRSSFIFPLDRARRLHRSADRRDWMACDDTR